MHVIPQYSWFHLALSGFFSDSTDPSDFVAQPRCLCRCEGMHDGKFLSGKLFFSEFSSLLVFVDSVGASEDEYWLLSWS